MSAHDVRHLDVCAKCALLGSRGHGLVKRDNAWFHPACLSPDELLALDADQLRTVRMCDLNTPDLLRVLARLDEEDGPTKRAFGPRAVHPIECDGGEART